MALIQAKQPLDHMPTQQDRVRANQLRQILAELMSKDRPVSMKLALKKGQTSEVILSPLMAQTFLEVSRLISSGKGFSIVPIDAMLTTQQAADMLNVSRPYVIKLLETNEINFTKIGRHRRIMAQDLYDYKQTRDSERARILADMAREDAENGYL